MSLATLEATKARVADLSFEGRAFLGAGYQPTQSGETFTKHSPIDGRVLAEVARCGAAEVDTAVATARQAFEDRRWSGLAPRERKQILLRFADLIERNSEELALLETLDMGKPIHDAESVDLRLLVLCMRWYAEALDKIYDELAPVGDGSIGMIVREPIGVVGAIIPWNFPLMLAGWKMGPALGMGNSLILKPAEQSPLSSLRLAALALEAGIPEGVLQVVPGFGEEAGRALALHGDVDAISFTGSGEVGKLILQYAGQSNMKHVSLECGGKSPNIVFADVKDLDEAAEQAAWGVFFNQGEVCSAGSRLLAHESVREELVERVEGVARTMRVGNPLDPETRVGAMVSDEQSTRVLDYIKIGAQEGASLRMGGVPVEVERGGCYIPPTIFDNVRGEMRIAQEEIFGPVLSVLSFQDEAEAIRLANNTSYGLGAAVWTRDINTAFRVGKAMRSGSVWINAYDKGDISTPFGGYKQSGIGRDKSLHALDKYSQVKTLWVELSQ